jgi:hypothetical protein
MPNEHTYKLQRITTNKTISPVSADSSFAFSTDIYIDQDEKQISFGENRLFDIIERSPMNLRLSYDSSNDVNSKKECASFKDVVKYVFRK